MNNNPSEKENLLNSINELKEIEKSIKSTISNPNYSKGFVYHSNKFIQEKLDKEISLLQKEIDKIDGTEQSGFSCGITVSLNEGMVIREMYNDNSESYTIIKSSVDNELYGVGQQTIIKLSDINDDDYTCDDVMGFKNEKVYFEFEKGKVLDSDDNVITQSKIVEMDEHLYSEIQEQLESISYSNWDNEFVDISVRKVSMLIEDFELQTNGPKSHIIKFRDKVKSKYEEMKKLQKG